ncbi:putative ribonuclease H-like domain-containing protein [Tanacetum coccineum]
MTKNMTEHAIFSSVQLRPIIKTFKMAYLPGFLAQESLAGNPSIKRSKLDRRAFVVQMDVKSAFIYGKIEEEVYVCQPLGFEDPDFPDKVNKVEKHLCTEFENMMHKKFQMSSMGELTFFLGLQVKQKEDGIFISQDKYVTEILKKFGFSDVRIASTPMETHKPLLKDADAEDVDEHLYRSMIGSLMIFRFLKGQPKLGLWYPKDSPFDLVEFTNNDYTRASLDRKSTIGGCQFLGCRLISWQCKKQTVVPNSTTEAEYIAALNCLKNPIFHSKIKHIEIRHHFIRDSYEKKLIQMIKIHTKQNVVDLLTKAFDVSRFQYLIAMKTVNEEVQLQALVDGKKVIITETSVRRYLHLEDAEGTECLPTATIFEELPRISAKTTAWNKFSSTMASYGKIMDVSKKIFANMKMEGKVFSGTITPLFQTMMVQPQEEMGEDEAANEENVPTHSNDPLPSSEDSLKLNELMELCTTLQKKVLDLETSKTTQALEIESLKRRVKKLEKKQRPRTHKLRRLYKGRKILDIDADEDITLDSTHFDTDPDMFRVHDLNGDEVFVETEEPVVNAATTTSTTVSAAKDLSDVDLTLAQALAELKNTKLKAEARITREKEEANAALVTQWNDIQDKVKTYYELAQRLQQEEQEELTIEEKSKLFQQLLEKRRKFFAAKRAKEKRNKPPTKAQ